MITKVLIKKFSDREDHFILVEITRNLDADWKPICGPTNWHDSRWRPK